jgi:hypothetical protein
MSFSPFDELIHNNLNLHTLKHGINLVQPIVVPASGVVTLGCVTGLQQEMTM